MTFTVIQNNVADRLNLTSTQALTRIGQTINEAHRRVCSSLGLPMLQRQLISVTTVANNPYLQIGPAPVPVEKVIAIQNPNFQPPLVLTESSYEELFAELATTDPPQRWAMFSATSNSVTVFFDSVISTAFKLSVVVLANMTTLSGNMTPVFAEDFHDILELAAMQVELRKLEKYDMAKDVRAEAESRVSDLRFFYAKSSFQDIVAGQMSTNDIFWNVPLV